MKTLALFCAFFFLTPSVQAQNYKKQMGPVADSETAVKVAEAFLIPIYGKKHILSERPFTATLENEVWVVAGTLHCGKDGVDSNAPCDGGVAMVHIRKKDGKVLSFSHGK